MPLVVGVAFQPVTKVYYFDPAGHDDLQSDERVVVDTARPPRWGRSFFPREVAPSELTGSLKPVVRRATAWDMVQHDQMAHKEPETRDICQQRADALRLDMKVVKAEYSFDGGGVVVYFSSEQRIDFRNLVHDIGQILHTRVEMRQVGVRDEAKFLGGYGRCGRPLCCASWLREFAPVSIKMAKTQDLPLNASEVSGVCGRLLCCLSYENDFYIEARQRMPKVNSVIDTPQGPGRIKQLNIVKNSVIAVVEGPGESLQYVEVALPEPVVPEDAAGGGCAGCAKRRTIVGSGDEVASASAEEAEGASTRTDDGELTGGTSDTQAKPASSGQSQGARSRPRRKKR